MGNYTVKKLKKKKTKSGKDHENETSKPPYTTIKSYFQSNTEVDSTVDYINFTLLHESWKEYNSDVRLFFQKKKKKISNPKSIAPTTPNPFQKLLEDEKKICQYKKKFY